MPLYILDISNHQGNFNITRAAAEGYSAIICKATEGRTFRDAKFNRNIPLIRNAGMIPGAYHFLRAGNGAAQARAFHARVAAHGGPSGWLCACDNEADASWATTTAFVAEWHRLTAGHPLIMYTGAWWWKPRGWNGASLTPHLWASRYVSGTGYGSELYSRVPASWWTPGYGGWPRATLLQYSSSARVAGQSVDVSAFEGTAADLRRLTNPSTPSGDTMDQNDHLVAETGNPGRTVGDHLGDMQRLRNWLIGGTGDGADVPPEGSPLAQLVEHAKQPAAQLVLTPEDRSAIAADLVSLLAPQLRAVGQLVERLGAAGDVLGVLNDPERLSVDDDGFS